jgi:hypothetical protein
VADATVLVLGDEWSPTTSPDSKDLISDWTQADELRQLRHRRHGQVHGGKAAK